MDNFIEQISEEQAVELGASEQELNSTEWRLSHLYYIKDIKGNKILFKPNMFQEFLLKNMWFMNIILKARQLGMTTFWCILFLDQVLFYPNRTAVIIAHLRESAEEFFQDKILFAWENLDESIKACYDVNTKNTRELKFSNGSAIRVTMSARSGTCQYLLVSELGIMAFKYPEKAKEVLSGSLNAVHKGQVVAIEATAKGQSGLFYDMCKTAINQGLKNENLSQMDYKFFFFPWWQDKKYRLEGTFVMPKEIQDYFTRLDERYGIKLDQEQRNWYFKKKSEQRDEMFSEYPSNIEEAFRANIEGAYYGKQFDRIMAENRICKVPWEPAVPVDTWWDLGAGDNNHILFAQLVGMEIHIIDERFGGGAGMADHAKHLKEKPYIYGNHYAPHDVNAKEIGTGKTRKATALKHGLPFIVVPKAAIDDGIEAVRNILPRVYIDEEKCPKLIAALIAYRKEWDDKLGVFKKTPLGDEHSHPADALRTGAMGLPDSVKYGRDPDKRDWFDKDDDNLQEEPVDKNSLFPQL